ncbi:MAG TPA: hypothetical protein VKU41_27420 [Polyangiaceae bacterium]|nr:hypothetical protein [Polyangiaceae bacterium]
MKRWIGAALAASLVALGACSGSSNSAAGSCGKVSPCGGNLVGTWKVVTTCSNASAPSGLMTGCPGESVSSSSTNASGTFTFNADMTYSVSLSETSSETLTIPTSCLTSQGGVSVSCSELGQVFGSGTSSDAGGLSVMCGTAGSNCSCTIDLSVQSANGSGTYSTSGSNLTITTANGSGMGNVDGYCVSGNTLHLIAAANDGGTTGTAFSGGDVVLTR